MKVDRDDASDNVLGEQPPQLLMRGGIAVVKRDDHPLSGSSLASEDSSGLNVVDHHGLLSAPSIEGLNEVGGMCAVDRRDDHSVGARFAQHRGIFSEGRNLDAYVTPERLYASDIGVANSNQLGNVGVMADDGRGIHTKTPDAAADEGVALQGAILQVVWPGVYLTSDRALAPLATNEQ
jgi:hypothetical protein